MKREFAHMARIKELPCAVCGAPPPSDAHHILDGRIPGRKSPDLCTIPLCRDCHEGSKNGIHDQRVMWPPPAAFLTALPAWNPSTLSLKKIMSEDQRRANKEKVAYLVSELSKRITA